MTVRTATGVLSGGPTHRDDTPFNASQAKKKNYSVQPDSAAGEQVSGRSAPRFDALKLSLHDGHNIINLEDHPHALGGQLERARVHEYRLDHVLRVHVADGALSHVDSCTREKKKSTAERVTVRSARTPKQIRSKKLAQLCSMIKPYIRKHL